MHDHWNVQNIFNFMETTYSYHLCDTMPIFADTIVKSTFSWGVSSTIGTRATLKLLWFLVHRFRQSISSSNVLLDLYSTVFLKILHAEEFNKIHELKQSLASCALIIMAFARRDNPKWSLIPIWTGPWYSESLFGWRILIPEEAAYFVLRSRSNKSNFNIHHELLTLTSLITDNL